MATEDQPRGFELLADLAIDGKHAEIKVDALIRLLLKKGVITIQDEEDLQDELNKNYIEFLEKVSKKPREED